MVFMTTNQFPGDYNQTTTSELSKPPPSECPRCSSTNTKFCYYNNYNRSQPRHYCKSCKRHWTKGGTLRNIPAGRRRRNKRPRAAAASASDGAAPLRKNFPDSFSLSNDDRNDMSDILYQALIRSSSPSTSVPRSTILESNGTTFTALNQNQNAAEFTLESLNVSIDPASDCYRSAAENVESTEELTSAAPPWAAEVWNWNEIDFLASLWD